MKNILMTGATGMIGSKILDLCINHPTIKSVTSLVRKASGKEHFKLKEIIISDFMNFDNLQDEFEEQDVAFFCLGVYTGQVSKEKFTEITVGYTKSFCDRLIKHSPEARICFLSGQGADQTEKSKLMFARDKGIAENYILNSGFRSAHLFRPAYIYPVELRKESNFLYSVFRSLYPILKFLFPKAAIKSTELAESMFKVGLDGQAMEVLENEDIKEILR